jgi:hypothetical protein
MRRELKWSDVKIDVPRKPPVEAQFRSAGGLALSQRGKIEIGKTYRLLELEDLVPGEENPGHVRFPAYDLIHPR